MTEELLFDGLYAEIVGQVRQAGEDAGLTEIRYLLDGYLDFQRQRMRFAAQQRGLDKAGKPARMIEGFVAGFSKLEKLLTTIMDVVSEAHPAAHWAKGLCAVGPITAAALLAHVDIEKAPTAGALWRFAGFDPSATWGRKEKRPHNASLKQLMWLAGENFKRNHNRPACFYGHIYADRKEQEVARNADGAFADQAAVALRDKKIGKGTDAFKWYSKGMLPPAHLDARACRVAIKMFLAHYWEVAYFFHYDERGPQPYVIAHGGHAHYVAPPDAPWDAAV